MKTTTTMMTTTTTTTKKAGVESSAHGREGCHILAAGVVVMSSTVSSSFCCVCVCVCVFCFALLYFCFFSTKSPTLLYTS